MRALIVLGAAAAVLMVGCGATTKTVREEVTVVHTVLVPGPTVVITVLVDAPTPTPMPPPAATEIPAPAYERCYFDQACLDRVCPVVLAAPEPATTRTIEDCAYWWHDLPSADPRRAFDRERVKAEICRREHGASFTLYEFGWSFGEATCP